MDRGLAIVGVLVALLLTVNFHTANGAAPKMERLAEGTWGALHVALKVSAESATIEYDCARGTIRGPLEVDRRGRFTWEGTHRAEHAGPIRDDEKPSDRPARYSGSVNDKIMTLNVTLTDTNQTLGPFTLTHGDSGRLFKCR